LGTQQYATQVVQNVTIANKSDHPAAYVQQWNLNIQRTLPGNWFVSAAYVGSKGTHLQSYSQQVNQIGDNFLGSAATQCAAQLAATPALPRCNAAGVNLLQSVANPFFDATTGTAFALGTATTTVGQLDRPFPQYLGLQYAGQGSYDSSYESFQLTVERKFANAGSILVAYTNSKLLSDTDTLTNWLEVAAGGIQDNNNNKAERSLSSQDVPQRLVISYVLDLPFGHGKRFMSDASGFVDKVVGGWGVDGVTIFQSGFPLVFSNGIANFTTLFGGGSRPNVDPTCNKGVSGGRSITQWFNTACFSAPADFTFGNESRTDPTLRGDGVRNFDFSVFKRTRFGPDERIGIEFRTEFFNIFNRTQFAPPNTSFGSSNFGTITSSYPNTNPRLIQFGLKLVF
jgi:hypothetical protein